MLTSEQTTTLLNSLHQLVESTAGEDSISRQDMISLLDVYIPDSKNSQSLTNTTDGYRQVTAEPKSVTFGNLSDKTINRIASYIPEVDQTPGENIKTPTRKSADLSLASLGFMLPLLPALSFLLPEGTAIDTLMSYTTGILDALDLGIEAKKKKDQLKRRKKLSDIKKQRAQTKANIQKLKQQKKLLKAF